MSNDTINFTIKPKDLHRTYLKFNVEVKGTNGTHTPSFAPNALAFENMIKNVFINAIEIKKHEESVDKLYEELQKENKELINNE